MNTHTIVVDIRQNMLRTREDAERPDQLVSDVFFTFTRWILTIE